MSSKLKLKSTAGGSLSLIIDDALATDEEMNISDGGIIKGSNANGEYTKFPDGTLICTGVTGASEDVRTFPHAFIASPIMTVSMNATVTNNVYLANIKSVTATTFSVYKFYHLKTKTDTLWGVSGQICNFIAIGRWK